MDTSGCAAIFFHGRAVILAVSLLAVPIGASAHAADNQDDAAIASVRKSAEQMVQLFNAGKADQVAAMFLPRGELVDEEGTVYQGQQEIKELLNAFFKQFPGAKL